MESELLIGLGGLVLLVLSYFAGVQRGKRYPDQDRKTQRLRNERLV